MTAPVTDPCIADCQRCIGSGFIGLRFPGGAPTREDCPDCHGTGQRHTATSCDECGVSLLVPWSVDHTLAPLRCESCAAVCNETEARAQAEKVRRWMDKTNKGGDGRNRRGV